jgi:2-methylisocitrate lyase-like PEP mutase family enzyme
LNWKVILHWQAEAISKLIAQGGIMDERRIDQQAKARQFAELHIPGDPLVLYNIWDAGGARTIAKVGAKAIATGSASLASTQGYRDGEQIPLDFLLQIVSRIVHVTDLPVTVDFEGAYASAPDDVASNVRRVVQTGAIGINFEDQVVGSDRFYTVDEQSRRIHAAHDAGEQDGVDLFINARTDLFLKERDGEKHSKLLEEAVERASAYREAGAKGFFVPGLTDPELIARICERVALPVNVMMRGRLEEVSDLRQLQVARVSYGPRPYIEATASLSERCMLALGR